MNDTNYQMRVVLGFDVYIRSPTWFKHVHHEKNLLHSGSSYIQSDLKKDFETTQFWKCLTKKDLNKTNASLNTSDSDLNVFSITRTQFRLCRLPWYRAAGQELRPSQHCQSSECAHDTSLLFAGCQRVAVTRGSQCRCFQPMRRQCANRVDTSANILRNS